MPRTTIKALAKEIRERWPLLSVYVERGYCNTDRKIRGTRLRHAGKGRWGTRIRVYGWDNTLGVGPLLLDHNNAETYRRTEEVRRWIDEYAKTHRSIASASSARRRARTSRPAA